MPRSALRRLTASGLLLAGLINLTTALGAAPPTAHAATLPASVDLSADVPPVGEQGSVWAANAAWATAYYLRGWYAKRDGYYPAGGPDGAGGYTPMYTYAQIAQGHEVAASLQQNLDLLQAQGVDSRADYTQGDYDFTTQPSAAERASAAQAKIDHYEFMGLFDTPQNYIMTKLAGGDPVVLEVPTTPELATANATHDLIPGPSAADIDYSLTHIRTDLMAFKYDASGVWVVNARGSGWGLNGWAELSWDYLLQGAPSVASIAPLSPLERFYNGTTSTHWVTRNAAAVTSGYHYERTLGLLFARPQSGTVPLYGCLAATGSNDHFVSLDSTCEGRVRLGLDGYLYSGWQLFVPTVQVYRCYRVVGGHGDHFVSTDPHCEGYTTDYSLGYLRL